MTIKALFVALSIPLHLSSWSPISNHAVVLLMLHNQDLYVLIYLYFCLNTSSGDVTTKGFSINVKLVREQQGAINIKKINIKQPKKKKIFNINTVQIRNKYL